MRIFLFSVLLAAIGTSLTLLAGSGQDPDPSPDQSPSGAMAQSRARPRPFTCLSGGRSRQLHPPRH